MSAVYKIVEIKCPEGRLHSIDQQQEALFFEVAVESRNRELASTQKKIQGDCRCILCLCSINVLSASGRETSTQSRERGGNPASMRR